MSTDEPCPAIGANLIALMTSEARERLKARFWQRTEDDPETGCMMTTYAPTTSGYGMCGITGAVTAETHRVAYVLAHGAIPSGRLVLHSCHNRMCVSLGHLRLGTHAENMQEMVEAGRTRHGPGSNPRKLCPEGALIVIGDQILGVPVKETARELDVSPGQVMAIRAGKRWRAAMSAHLDAELAAQATERDRKGH